jgi:Flp pilus assembly protein TadD
MTTERRFIDVLDRDAAAALAEAWHVDGLYRQAAMLWQSLPPDALPAGTVELKVASALLSLGEIGDGAKWLNRAHRAGAPDGEIDYMRGRVLAEQGAIAAGLASLERVVRAGPARGGAANAAGVVLWRAGRKDEATARFRQAARIHPADGDALVNLATVGAEADPVRARALLREAIRRKHHKHEPFVILSRVLSRSGDSPQATDMLARARLRQQWLGTIPGWQDVLRTPATGRAVVRGVVSPDVVDLTVRLKFPSGYRQRSIVVNAGYDIWTNGEVATAAEFDPRASGVRVAAPAVLVDLPNTASGDNEVRIRLRGVPLPPAARLSPTEMELDGISGWLPVPVPPVPMRWDVQLDTPPGYVLRVSTTDERPGTVGVLATSGTERSTSTGERGPSQVTMVSSNEGLLFGAAARWASRAAECWGELLCPLPIPPIVVVDRPQSRYAYARQNYLRITSGLARDPVQIGQIAHEIGHLWWGIRARFTPENHWLGEALAEYSHHLLEDRGENRGYRARALASLKDVDGGVSARRGMDRLAGRTDAVAMFALRVKGGFVMGMLRQLLGETAFGEFLRAAFDHGSRHELDTYTFFALASWYHGSSVRWFANQWVHADGVLELAVGEPVTRKSRTGIETTVETTLRGTHTCGVPVVVEIEDATGRRVRQACDVDAGGGRVMVRLDAEPVRVTVDPDSRLFAMSPMNWRKT